MFRRFLIGAHKGQDDVGVVGAAGPHLLPVHHEVLVHHIGTGTQTRQIRARTRFAHAQRRRHLGTQDGHRPLPLLLLGAERQQRGGDDADALRVERVIDAASREFLAVNELFKDARIAAAELGRIARKEPAVVELEALPPARPLRYMRRRSGPLGLRLGLRRQVCVEKVDELRAKRPTSASKVSCTDQQYQVLNIWVAVRYD